MAKGVKMGTLTKSKPRKKKLKKKLFRATRIENKKTPSWEGLDYEEIRAITPETLKKIREEKTRSIRVYVNHIKRVEWSTFLLDIIIRNNEKFLIIQRLGIRGNQKKTIETIEIAVTKEISIELSI